MSIFGKFDPKAKQGKLLLPADVVTILERDINSISRVKPGDAGFTAIKDAWFGNTSIEFAILDGDVGVAGSQGLRGTFSVTKFSRSEPLEEALSVSVTAKPTYAENAP